MAHGFSAAAGLPAVEWSVRFVAMDVAGAVIEAVTFVVSVATATGRERIIGLTLARRLVGLR